MLGVWRLIDYVRDERRMSATWCTHPQGEDADLTGGLGVVPQAITVDGPVVGRGRPPVPRGAERAGRAGGPAGRPAGPAAGPFRRPPPVTAPEAGIPVPPHGSVHLSDAPAAPRLTEVEIFAFDPDTAEQVGELRVQAELLRNHPGENGHWCAQDEDAAV